jgi:DedD protein
MAEQQLASNRGGDDVPVDLKKRARRRLVGAAALALLAVIVLPMVMDQEPKPTSQEIQVRIPSQDGSTFTSRILPNKPAATPLPPVEVAPKEAVVAPPTPTATPAPLPVEIQPEGKAAPAAGPEKPAAVPEKPVDKTPDKPADATRAATILAGGGDTAQWVVNLGAYSEPGNVRLLQKKIKELALPVYTEKVDTAQGERTRVRVGPFANREAAERAQGKLKKIGAGGPNGGTVAQK